MKSFELSLNLISNNYLLQREAYLTHGMKSSVLYKKHLFGKAGIQPLLWKCLSEIQNEVDSFLMKMTDK